MLISVIIPAYNVVKTLENSVKSVIKQDISDYEIIIVNDGSTDATPNLCDQLANQYAQVRVIHKENGGLSSARNTGIENARGEFIAFLDSDDEYTDGLFSRFIDAFNKHEMSLYIFNLSRIKGNEIEERQNVNLITEDNSEAVEIVFTHNGADFYAWNKIWHKDLFIDNLFPVGKIYEDMNVTYNAAKKANRIVFEDFPGIFYYENDESITAQKFNEKQFDNVTERVRLLNSVQKDYPNLVSYAARRLLDGILDNAYRLSGHDNRKEVKYYNGELKKIFNNHQELFKRNDNISLVKRIAWKLYLLSPKMYKKAYEFYLH